MPQFTIYLDLETDQLLREASRPAAEPASKWIADAIRLRVRHEWPAEVLAIPGNWPAEFPDSAALRAGLGDGVPREIL